jgi:hypothetical protein
MDIPRRIRLAKRLDHRAFPFDDDRSDVLSGENIWGWRRLNIYVWVKRGGRWGLDGSFHRPTWMSGVITCGCLEPREDGNSIQSRVEYICHACSEIDCLGVILGTDVNNETM